MSPPVALGQVEPTECPTAPAPVDPEGLADDAIETRNQRIADVQICEAIRDRLDNLYETSVDTRRFGGWIVGVLLTVLTFPIMARIVRAGG